MGGWRIAKKKVPENGGVRIEWGCCFLIGDVIPIMNYLDRSACSNGWVGAEGETVSRAGELRSALDLKTFKKKEKKGRERIRVIEKETIVLNKKREEMKEKRG